MEGNADQVDPPQPGAATWAFTKFFGARDAEIGEQPAVTELVTVLIDQPGWTRGALAATVAALTRDLHRTGQGYYHIEQALGRVLNAPEYGPEMGAPAGDVCVGEHTPETLAAEAADRIRLDTRTFEVMRQLLDAAHQIGPTLPKPTRTELALASVFGAIRDLVNASRPRKDPHV